jgi:hypothetical protein
MVISDSPKSSKLPQSSDSNDSAPDISSDDLRLDNERSARRIQELKTQRDEILGQVQAQRGAEPALQHDSINRAVDEFNNFFTGYTDYFFSLSPDQVTGHDRTYESVLNRALDNMRQLWEQLSLAINQRYNPACSKKLKEADEKAELILKKTKTIVHGMPILYFNKIFQISRHPYQTYPLLGISQDRLDFDGDASLAHELGHHVFWNNGELEEYAARLDFLDEQIARIILADKFPDVDFSYPATTQRAIRSRFDQYTIWVAWIEETFADVFGSLITGPKFAKSAQDVLIRERLGRPSDLIVSDGEHPVPALRPFIATETLKVIAGLRDDPFRTELKTLTTQLEERWQPIWEEALKEEEQGLPKESVGANPRHADMGERPAVTLGELRNQIAPMVNLVLTNTKFASFANAQKQTNNLLTVLNYWGKEPKVGDDAEIEQLQSKLTSDPITSIANRIAGGVVGGRFGQEPDAESLFDRFLKYVEERRLQKPKLAETQPEVWQTVLEFDLTLDHGVQAGVCHKHTTLGTVSC